MLKTHLNLCYNVTVVCYGYAAKISNGRYLTMKKILALVMALAMLLVSASAFAEAAYTYTEYSYDESLFTEIGGEWLAMEDLGLMFYLTDIYMAAEVPEALVEVGTIALFATEDGSSYMTIAYGPALNAEGNAAATVEELAAYLTAIGSSNVDVIIVNGIPVVTSMNVENDTLAYSVFYEDGTQCLISFAPASDATTALMGGLTL